MLVAKFKDGPGFGRRWALTIEHWSIFLEKQVMQQPEWIGETEKWRPNGVYFGIGLKKEFRFGGHHMWYDGPHCAWDFGWLYFTWSYWPCKKCSNDITE